jgi:hypothetical protein
VSGPGTTPIAEQFAEGSFCATPVAWFTGVWLDPRIEHLRSVTEYDRDGDAQQILREPVRLARPAASEEFAAG